MNRQLVVEELIAIHTALETDLGHEVKVDGGTCPLDDLPGFDSTVAPNVVRTLARHMRIEVPVGANIKNVYVSADRKRRLTINEVADRFCSLYGTAAA